ncbi:polysaccharide deacetylase family protein [Flavobacterium oreochromis]|uniref:Polysaccharide deacetylase n=2 Tax=Flavobacterium TaxID=237 RepID=A0A246GBH2_9FLAO|nr:polysaccharide deacetylase family protein [Flavobacterium oreochromis]OWP76629.1 polysaccharide deacetylase [Flavobacterium oreochromis]OWP77977.1 polysaccharide deacetylase [Flavobacterium oreochromis]POR25893.1 polysaccharide deacetylase [Flavobacterium columnare]
MILLSFDIEEFDMPFEYGKEISFEEQMSISIAGTNKILDLLERHQIKATFFSTATFAMNAKSVIERIIQSGHEIASHNYYHTDFEVKHLKESKDKLEELTGTNVIGFRMPRMYPVDEKEIQKAGYVYNSSINPTFLPGRYNHLDKPRKYFYQDQVLQIPASVSPWVRFPLFWLSFHNLPMWIYKFLANWTYSKDGYLNIYLHPWEFTDLNQPEKFNFPGYVVKNSGDALVQRLDEFITHFKKKEKGFGTFKEFIETIR